MRYNSADHTVVRTDDGATSVGGYARLWFTHNDSYRGFHGEKADVRFFDTEAEARAFIAGFEAAT